MSTSSSEKDLNVCSFFKEERKRLKLNQNFIANFLGMSPKQIGRWESTTAIPADKLSLLVELGFDVQFVVTGKRAYSNDFDLNIQERAIDIVVHYISLSGKKLVHPEKFYPIVMEIYNVIKTVESKGEEVNPIELGAKVIPLFAA